MQMSTDVKQTICQDSEPCEDQHDSKENMDSHMCKTHEYHDNNHAARVYPINHTSKSEMHAVLSTRDLWQQFDQLNTEMIVTRRGR